MTAMSRPRDIILRAGHAEVGAGDVGRYGEIWGDMGRYGEIWGDMGSLRAAHAEVREVSSKCLGSV